MIQVEEALERILGNVSSLGAENVPLASSGGRILAEQIVAPIDLPAFDNSAMDGYAVHSDDLKGASPNVPVSLKLLGRIAAGEAPEQVRFERGGCVRVFTGSPVPSGANAVVMQEDTRSLESGSEAVEFLEAPRPWEFVRFRGEDIRKESAVIEPGTRIGFGEIAVLGALGFSEVSVRRQPRVALLATGNELTEPGDSIRGGGIYESNRQMLAQLVDQSGCQSSIRPIVIDDAEATRVALDEALASHDVVISTGGVSVGEMDFVKSAFEEIGGQLDFWRLSMRPGKPFTWGRRGDSVFFGLPGNPVSALVTFLILVRPFLLKQAGASELGLPIAQGALTEVVQNPGDRRHYVRVNLTDGKVSLSGRQASHAIHPLLSCNGLVDVGPGVSLEVGRKVEVLMISGD